MKHKQLNRKSLTGARAQVRATGEIVFVKKGKRIKNPWGWYSQMWNFTEDGRVFHDDELILLNCEICPFSSACALGDNECQFTET